MRRLLGSGDGGDSDDEDQDDDDDDNNILHFDLRGHAMHVGNIAGTNVSPQHRTPPAPPKKTRAKYPRKDQKDSLWWREYLANAPRVDLLLNPHGRLSRIFRRDFHVPFELFQELVQLVKDRWYPTWNDSKVCRAGKPVSHLELKVLGGLYTLANGATQFMVSRHTNLSEEIHRTFFIKWIHQMASISDEFIYMPKDDITYKRVVGEYTARGFPGCIGSIDCVHIGWDKCPTQYTNLYTGKEGFPSIAYEVICTSRKFIQSVTVGHPGTRNDKHIVRTDDSVLQILYGNGWLNSKRWQCSGRDGITKTFRGVYLICDGGYHRWPCLVSPYNKNDTSGTPTPSTRWSKNLESVRKDIEGVFGILKIRFKFLKHFNSMHKQRDIDAAFVTCCMFHNMMLRIDGYLDDNLSPYPGGLEESLRKKFNDHRWNGLHGMWTRGDDDTPFENGVVGGRQVLSSITPFASAKYLESKWKEVTEALIEHHQFHIESN